jgi:hypothetical protein
MIHCGLTAEQRSTRRREREAERRARIRGRAGAGGEERTEIPLPSSPSTLQSLGGGVEKPQHERSRKRRRQCPTTLPVHAMQLHSDGRSLHLPLEPCPPRSALAQSTGDTDRDLGLGSAFSVALSPWTFDLCFASAGGASPGPRLPWGPSWEVVGEDVRGGPDLLVESPLSVAHCSVLCSAAYPIDLSFVAVSPPDSSAMSESYQFGRVLRVSGPRPPHSHSLAHLPTSRLHRSRPLLTFPSSSSPALLQWWSLTTCPAPGCTSWSGSPSSPVT